MAATSTLLYTQIGHEACSGNLQTFAADVLASEGATVTDCGVPIDSAADGLEVDWGDASNGSGAGTTLGLTIKKDPQSYQTEIDALKTGAGQRLKISGRSANYFPSQWLLTVDENPYFVFLIAGGPMARASTPVLNRLIELATALDTDISADGR